MSDEPKKKRGFAAWTAEKRAEVSSRGGKAAHAKGTAHQFDSAEALAAGSKGGHAAHAAWREKAVTETNEA